MNILNIARLMDAGIINPDETICEIKFVSVKFGGIGKIYHYRVPYAMIPRDYVIVPPNKYNPTGTSRAEVVKVLTDHPAPEFKLKEILPYGEEK